MTRTDTGVGDITKPVVWDQAIAEGRRLAEGVPLGMALEGLTAADLAYQGTPAG
ncbi:hypothetical protein ACFO3J_12615 [Streptomyces polygonati]|uniref:Uncharacterized protein n=1 Tax=Streptomyces polygonati TaxID=1617087 RepID=A0ABV8HMC1_9ACTN